MLKDKPARIRNILFGNKNEVNAPFKDDELCVDFKLCILSIREFVDITFSNIAKYLEHFCHEKWNERKVYDCMNGFRIPSEESLNLIEEFLYHIDKASMKHKSIFNSK